MKTLSRPLLFVTLMVAVFAAPILHKANAQTTGAAAAAQKPLYARLAWRRSSPTDLELDGDIPGATRDQTKRYITRDQLLMLPQVSDSVTNDPNFTGPVKISGVPLDQLLQALTTNAQADLVVAICSDGYKSYYPHSYLTAHNPVLALKIDGKDPAEWPTFRESGAYMGPYLISSADYKPSFKILSYNEEPHIPWGVVRLEIRSQADSFTAIHPPASESDSTEVQLGFRIASLNCLRCHNSGDEGGTKAQRPWPVLSTWATASPDFFAAYIHDPKSKNPKSEMPGFPEYNAATLDALTKYFQSFADDSKSKKP